MSRCFFSGHHLFLLPEGESTGDDYNREHWSQTVWFQILALVS